MSKLGNEDKTSAAHNREIAAGLGYSDVEIAALIADGVLYAEEEIAIIVDAALNPDR